MEIARRCFVSGRVQGVYYRGATREKALQLNCRGYARNLRDGRVEVLIVGEQAPVEDLIEWLWRGPPAASVAQVDVEELELASLEREPAGFSTGRE